MEWISEIPEWVWWDIGLVIMTGIITWFTEHFRLSGKLKDLAELKAISGKNFDELKAKYVIDDLERYGKILERFEGVQNSEGLFYPVKGNIRDIELAQMVLDFGEKYKDWTSLDEKSTLPNQRARETRKEIINSISLLRLHGYKKALEIRKKSCKNP